MQATTYLFLTRASVNKRHKERLGQIEPAEVKQTLDDWIKEVYSGLRRAFQIIPFPIDHTAIHDNAERIRLP